MSEAESLHGQEHLRRYRETNRQVGHIWRRGWKALLLTTTGRKSGRPGTTPLIYESAGDDYVIIASNGGAPEHPGCTGTSRRSPASGAGAGDIFRVATAPPPATSVHGSGSLLRSSGPHTTTTR